MKYYVNYKNNKWSVWEASDNCHTTPKVECRWNVDETMRSYTIQTYANSMTEALEKGQALILAYIEEHRNPLTTLTEVVNGEASFRTMPEIIHELCRAVLDMEKK